MPAKEFYDDFRLNTFLNFGVILIGLRACTSLSIFYEYRVQIFLFKQVFIDLVEFLSLVFYILVIMALIYGVQTALDENADDKTISLDNIAKKYLHNFGLFYRFMLDKSPYDIPNMNYTQWMIFFIFCLLIKIISLNLIIALISNTFSNVYGCIQANHTRN